MPAIRKNLTVDQGSTFTVSVRFKDSTGTPINLTGHTVTFNLFKAGRTTSLFTHVAAVTSDGWINILATDEQTLTFPLGKNAYIIDHETPDGTKNRLFFGSLEVRSGVDV